MDVLGGIRPRKVKQNSLERNTKDVDEYRLI